VPWQRRLPTASPTPGDVDADDSSYEAAGDLFDAIDADGEEIPAGPDAPDAAVETTAPALDEEAREQYRLAHPLTLDLTLRSYQQEAVAAWQRAEGRGVIVLPTGAGKTVVALHIIATAGVRTLVVAPTIDLLHQWRSGIADRFGLPIEEIGIVGGGKRTMRDITVMTYDSAAMPSRKLDRFGLLVVDETHHLPAQAYRTIARKMAAPFRLGLSATLERSDGGHHALPHLLGPLVYERSVQELSRDSHIAAYDERRIFVDLDPKERARYEWLMAEWSAYLATNRSQLGAGEHLYASLIRRAGFDPGARAALRAHQQARMLALNADSKIAAVEQLLAKHRDDKVIVFAEFTTMVDRLSERLLLPAITYRTPLPERKAILSDFRSGAYRMLVTGRVLNEGVDVPDANVAIVVSGSSATREYIQRLGRVLRPKADRAVLYEVIARKTIEGKSARKRRPRESAPFELGAE
jgi:superfamily II DNA or RNA helicase